MTKLVAVSRGGSSKSQKRQVQEKTSYLGCGPQGLPYARFEPTWKVRHRLHEASPMPQMEMFHSWSSEQYLGQNYTEEYKGKYNNPAIFSP